MFESFNVPCFYLTLTSGCVMRQHGARTGVSVEVGGGLASIVPFYEGYPMTHAAETIPLAGRDITSYLHNRLLERGQTVPEQEVEEIKKRVFCS